MIANLLAVTPATTRKSADVRREEILEAALVEFARGGLYGTSTEEIARRAGISQPYLFRLFGTKKELFLAATARCFARVQAAFEEAADGLHGEQAMRAMGQAYARLLEDREALLLQMQMYAACGDPDVRDVARKGFAGLYRYVAATTEASSVEVRDFFARGMLMNVAAAIDLPDIADPDSAWTRELVKKR